MANANFVEGTEDRDLLTNAQRMERYLTDKEHPI